MRKIGALFIAFLALALWVYFYEIEGEKKRQDAKTEEESLFRMDRDKIASVDILRKGHDSILLEKINDGWTIKSPLEAPADKVTVDSLLNNIETARIERTFEDAVIEQYGLAQPRLELMVQSESTSKVLNVGDEDFTGSKIYVQVKGESRVHVVSDQLLTSCEKNLLDWRDKKVVSMDRDKIRSIEILRVSEKIKLKKDDGKWQLESPLEELADQGTITGLLSSLEFAEAKEFISEESTDLSKYGLEKPQLVVRFQEEGQEHWETLELGSNLEETGDHYHARNASRNPVFSVTKEIREKLLQDIWEFRHKDVIDVDQDEVTVVVVKTEEGEITVRREDYKWILEKPETKKESEVQAYKFWYPIDDIKFESIAPVPSKAEFNLPKVEVQIQLKDGSVQNFEFYQNGESYLARKVESGRSGTISKEAYQKLQFKVDDIV